jgi:hypothetical protein
MVVMMILTLQLVLFNILYKFLSNETNIEQIDPTNNLNNDTFYFV